jgi:hypothetical protein
VFVVVGVHNWVRWCDIVTSISSDDSAGKILAMYYNNGEKEFMRWKNLQQYSVRSTRGTNLRVTFDVAEGNRLTARFVIG